MEISQRITPYFYINNQNFIGDNVGISNNASATSQINLVKNKMYNSNTAWSYNDIQWTNFTGEDIDLTVYVRINEPYKGDEVHPEQEDMKVESVYQYTSEGKVPTVYGVLKYWAQNFVPLTVRTNLPAFENGVYIIESFKQTQPVYEFIEIDLSVTQYEKPTEIVQTYWKSSSSDIDTSMINSSTYGIMGVAECSQECSCNEYTPAEQCTSTYNEDVALIQSYLQSWGYFPTYSHETGSITYTGKYCYQTTQALAKFQKACGIPVTGNFTAETRNKFVEKIKNG